MNIEKMKQLIELSKLFDSEQTEQKQSSSIYDYYIGKQVIIRTYSAGVHYGTLNRVENDSAVELKNSRRIHYWDGANSLTDIALGGILNKKDSRITKKLPSIVLNNTIEIIECTEKSIIDLDSFPEWTKIWLN